MSNCRPGIIFIGMETSGALRRRFQAKGFETYSCDTLPCEDAGGEDMAISPDGLPLGRHIVGDVYQTLDHLWSNDLWPSFAMFHITCTFLTGSAEWAYKDPDFTRYPDVGYHQKLKPGTLFGAERRAARKQAQAQFQTVRELKIKRKVVENPVGALSEIMKPTQIIQPNWFGDDASKKTCLWAMDQDGRPLADMRLTRTGQAQPRIVDDGRAQLGLFGTGVARWSNQTDAGQNALSPDDDRWKERSRTFPGVADAMADQWAELIGS